MAKIYNCTVNYGKDNWITYRAINHLGRFVTFIDGKFGDTTSQRWNFFNVYDNEDKSKSNNILGTFQNGEKRNVPTGKYL